MEAQAPYAEIGTLIEGSDDGFPAFVKADFHFAYQLFQHVRRNFERYGLFDDQAKFLPGWFRDTLPTAPIDRLALLRLDGDMYEATMDSLDNLYAKVSPGGFVIVDDYGSWPACRLAVDRFRESRAVTAQMIAVAGGAAYWRVPAGQPQVARS